MAYLGTPLGQLFSRGSHLTTLLCKLSKRTILEGQFKSCNLSVASREFTDMGVWSGNYDALCSHAGGGQINVPDSMQSITFAERNSKLQM